MKPFVRAAAIVALILLSLSAAAAPFTPGNIVVYRVGDGVAAITGAATPVFLDEYSPGGTLVQSIPLPTSGVVAPQRLCTAAGTATTEGFLSRSPNGLYLAFGCYDATVGTATPNSTSPSVPRVLGRIDAGGVIDTSTSYVEASGAGNIRSVTTSDGNRFWSVGSTVGLRTATLGSSTTTTVSTTNTTRREVHVYGGQLYDSSGAGTTYRLGQVGTGLPITAGTATTNLPGLPVTQAYKSFFFADLDAGTPGLDTLYIADETAGAVSKWNLIGGTWTAKGSVALATARGLAGIVNGTSVTLYAVGGTTNLTQITDASGFNATMTGSFSGIATGTATKAFRGVALVPVGPPKVVSSNRAGASPTNATTVNYTVVFDQDVSGVDNADFTPANTGGTTTGSVTGVTPVDGKTYTVAVNLGGGDGAIRLDVTDDNSIVSVATGLQLGGPGAGDGNFTTGQSYQIDRTAPTVSSSVRADANPTTAASVNFTVTFSKPVSNVDNADFALTTTGLSGASVTGVSGGPSVYTVTVGTGTGNGTLRLDVNSGGVSDAAGNLLTPAFTTGETYDVNRDITTVASIVRASGTNPTNATTLPHTVTFTANVNGVATSAFAVTRSEEHTS